MIATVLEDAGLDPTIIIGGMLRNFASNAKDGKGDVIVVEADEYDRTFHELHPEIAVITNIEADHLEYYGSFENIVEAFRIFTENVRPGGAIIGCVDDPAVAALLDRRRPRQGSEDHPLRPRPRRRPHGARSEVPRSRRVIRSRRHRLLQTLRARRAQRAQRACRDRRRARARRQRRGHCRGHREVPRRRPPLPDPRRLQRRARRRRLRASPDRDPGHARRSARRLSGAPHRRAFSSRISTRARAISRASSPNRCASPTSRSSRRSTPRARSRSKGSRRG